jgi:long-chain fatty acid transport protein
MQTFFFTVIWFCLVLAATSAHARPYPGLTGLVASADSPATAGTNPAGLTRFKSRAIKGEILGFYSDNTWEGDLGNTGVVSKSEDTNTTVIPTGYLVQPINENWALGFTILGSGFSEDFGDWPGKYFIESYDMVYITAYPSLAYRVSDRLSIAASLAISYSSYEQERSVLNPLDPGFGDGRMKIEADGTAVGFGVSALYQFTNHTRLGLVYNSELDPELEGKAKFTGLGPNTEAALAGTGLINADIDQSSRMPQSLLAGLYHEFHNGHALTLDVVWADFSEFKLSEQYVNGTSISGSNVEYDDIFAISASYTLPLNDRWMLGVGGLYMDDMVDDTNRTLALRLDSMWSIGAGIEWQWTDKRALSATVRYLSIGDAPVTSPTIPGLGALSGKYTNRDVIQIKIGVTFGGSS